MCSNASDINSLTSSKGGHYLNFFHINIRSIRNKSSYVFNSLIANKIDVASINETWLNCNISNASLFFTGYSIVRLDRLSSKGGGVCLLVKHGFIFERCNSIVHDDVELLHISLNRSNLPPLHVITVYRPPSGSFNNAIDKLENLLKILIESGNGTIVAMGDFNVDVLAKKSFYTKKLTTTLTQHGFSLVNQTEPTRITSTSRSLIDVAFYRGLKDGQIRDFSVVDTVYSDHRGILFRCVKSKIKVDVPVTTRFVPNYDVDYACFSELLDNADLSSLLVSELSPNNLFCAYFERILNVVAQLPTRKVAMRNSRHPWINARLLNLYHKCDYAYKLWRKNKDTYHYRRHVSLKRECKRLSITLRRNYFSQQLSNLEFATNPKVAWALLNRLISDKSKRVGVSKLVIDGRSIDDPMEIVENLNTYFTSVVSEIYRELPVHETLQLDRYVPQFADSLDFQLPTFNCILKYISGCRSNNGSDYSIPLRLLHNFPRIFAFHLHRLISISMFNLCYPDCLKVARVVPVHKKGSYTLMENYRPISTLGDVNAVFEKVLYQQIIDFILKNRCLYSRQYGFRPYHSTVHCNLDFTNFVASELDKGYSVAAVFIDFTKAFDMIDHAILLQKLKIHFNFSENSCALISSYLENRCQFVAVGGVHSSVCNIPHGVPQGSLLGPLLFLLYVNDLYLYVEHSILLMYADDSTLVISAPNMDVAGRCLQSDLNAISSYCSRNRLLINSFKTKYMLFCCSNMNLELSINCDLIEHVSNFNLLGMRFNNRLSFADQCDYIASKLLSCAFILRRFRSEIPSRSLFLIYISIAYSHLNYCSPAFFTFLNKREINLLNSRVYKCKSILAQQNANFDLNLFCDVQDSYFRNNEELVKNLLYKNEPVCLRETLLQNDHVYNTRFKGFVHQRAAKEIGRCSFRCWGPLIASNLVNNNDVNYNSASRHLTH